MAVRNTTPEEAQEKTLEVMKRTRAEVEKLFTAQQKIRMQQISYRLRGLSFVLIPQASAELGLSSQQRDAIQAVVSDTLEVVNSMQSKTYQGAEAHQKAKQTVAAARKREQEEILAALDDSQKTKLVALVGKKFDPRSLGRVTFKAPELADGDQWLNSDALKICLLYTSPSPRDATLSRMPSSA